MGMQRTIWIVDDDSMVLDVLSTMVSSLGYKVRTFGDPQHLLRDYGPQPPDVVITDVRMPVMSGIQLTKALIAKDARALVIVLTGFPSVPDVMEALRSGASDYLSKPTTTGELHVRIERLLENRHLQDRLKFTRFVATALIESLPLWLIMGMLVAKLFQ